jgi:hypothetical protein
VLSVLKTKAPDAQLATCSPAEVLKPRTSCKPSGPCPMGFVQARGASFDHLVGAGEQRRGNGEAERLRL